MLVKTLEFSNVPLGASEQDITRFFISCHNKDYLQMQSFDPRFSQVKTVEVSNVPFGASEQDITEFFQFCGDIEYVEMQSDNELTQIAYVTFKDSQGAKIAVHQSGATMADLTVTVTLKPDYMLPPAASEPIERVDRCALPTDETTPGSEYAVGKAGDVVSSMLATKQTFNRATTALIARTLEVQEELRKFVMELQEFRDKTRDKVGEAGEEQQGKAVDGYAQVSEVEKAVGEVSQKTEEKVGEAEEKRERKAVDGYAQVLSESPKASAPSELGASTPAKRRKLKRPIGWERETLRR